jgi:WD40 repeat protein
LTFVSYARQDLDAVHRLKSGLELMGCQIWMDLEAGGGSNWWHAILARIRDCDLFISVLSDNGLSSLACTRERTYALALGKRVIPVVVAPLPPQRLPASLAPVHVIDFVQPNALTVGIRLTLAVKEPREAAPLPDPLPPEPPIPLSYTTRISELIHAPDLPLHDQMACTAMLREAARHPGLRDDAVALTRIFVARDDLFVKAHRQLLDSPELGLLVAGGPPGGGTGTLPRDRPYRTLECSTAVHDAAFSPDGQLLATVGDDGTIRLWNPHSGQVLREVPAHDCPVLAVAFSADGVQLATAGKHGEVRLWDPVTGLLRATLVHDTAPVYDVTFSPDPGRLATAGADGRVLLWDPADGRRITTLADGAAPVLGVSFSPDGALIASCDAIGRTVLWEVATGDHVRTLPGHDGPVGAVAFSPDGKLLASAGDDTTTRLWDPATGAHRRTLAGHAERVRAVAFAPGSSVLLATASDDTTTRLWNPVTGERLSTLAGHTDAVRGVAFSPDGTLLVTTSDDKTARVRG